MMVSTKKHQEGQERIAASPLARRIARRHGIALERVLGTGPRGRIIQKDIQKIIQGVSSIEAKVPIATQEDPRHFFEKGHYQEKKQEPLRTIIAQRLTDSFRSIPHYALVMSCRVDALVKYLARTSCEPKMTLNHALIFATIKALLATPQVNVTYCGDGILYHKDAHVGIAVATEGGIMTPIVHADAQTCLLELVKRVDDLISRARLRRLKPEEYQGGVMGISNLGMFGVEQFGAIINPPQSSMLTLGAIMPCPHQEQEKKGEVVFLPSIKATLVCDHRVIDGALGAAFLSSFKKLLKKPSSFLAVSGSS